MRLRETKDAEGDRFVRRISRTVILTVSREYGAAGLGVAKVAAELLGFRLIDSELPKVVASRMGTSPEAVDASETSRPLATRILLGLSLANVEVRGADPTGGDTFTEDVRRETEAAVREFAKEGDVLILGRFANMILGARDDTLRVLLHAPRDWRVSRIAELYHANVKSAASEVDRLDEARKHWALEYYDMVWGDTRHYDLTIDVSRFGIEGSGQLIADAVERTRPPE